MVSRAGAGDRSDPCARQTNGNIGVADHGIEPGKAISELPPGTEPGQVVGKAKDLAAGRSHGFKQPDTVEVTAVSDGDGGFVGVDDFSVEIDFFHKNTKY